MNEQMWLYLSCGSTNSDLLFLETYRISLTRPLGILRRTFLLPFSCNIAWRFNSNHKLTERLSLRSLTLLPPPPRARSCHRQESTHHLRHDAWRVTSKCWMFWLGWKKILRPGLVSVLTMSLPGLSALWWTEQYLFFFLFSLFLHDSLSNQRSTCHNKYCYGWNFSQEIIIIITADCLLCSLTFSSWEKDKNTHS